MPNPAERYRAPIRWRYDTANTDFSPRSRPFLPPSAGIFDAPHTCVKINIGWLPHIIGALDALTQFDAWVGDNDGWAGRQQIDKLIRALSDAESCVEIGVGTLLRQNPANACQLQQSQDGGLTWSLAFDYSRCRPRELRALLEYEINNHVTNILNDIRNTYNNTVVSVAPDMVYDNTSEDDIRDLALCYACQQIVIYCCELELERREVAITAAGITSIVLGAVGGLIGAGIILSTAGLGTVLAFTVMSAALGAGATLFGELLEDQLTDDELRERVTCCMYNALRGQTPEKALFESSLDNCGFDFFDPVSRLRDGIAYILSEPDVHPTFLKFAAENLRAAELGLINCPCDEWVYEWDLTLSSSYENFSAADGATVEHIVGVGLRSTKLGFNYIAAFWTAASIPIGVSFTSASMDYNKSHGSDSLSQDYIWLISIGKIVIAQGAAGTGTLTASGTYTMANADSIFPQLACNAPSDVVTTLVIQKFRIGGTGDRPALSGGAFL